jgi:hypothetical protein
VSRGFGVTTTGSSAITNSLLTWWLAEAIQPGATAQVTASVRLTSPIQLPASLVNTFGVTASNQAPAITGSLTTPITATNLITLSKAVTPASLVGGG